MVDNSMTTSVAPKKDELKSSFFGRYLAKPLSYFVFVLWTVITIAPLVWMAYSSFKTNEELTKDMYSLPSDLFHQKERTFDVVKSQAGDSINWPAGYLESLGLKKKDYDGINKRVLILESETIGMHRRVFIFFFDREKLPDGFKLSDGRDLKTLKPGKDVKLKVSDLPKSWQRKIHWQSIWWNYTSAWRRGELSNKFLNSVIYTVVSTFLVVFLGLMLGYGVSKFKYKKTAALVAALIGLGYLLDVNQVLVPLFLMMANLGLTDTHIGIILIYTAFGLPMAVMLSSTFIKGLPNSLIESAYIDGATPFRSFVSIIVPMTVPVIITISIMTALGIWNEFLLVLVMASRDGTKSLPVAIYSFSGKQGLQLGWQVASLILATLPILIVYFSFQSNLAEGVAGGAIKE